jgi:hypothetical protein
MYTADGDEKHVETAPLQLGVLYADKDTMKTAAELQSYILDVYANSRTEQWITQTPTSTTACKVGRNLMDGRFFVAVHACAEKKTLVACAEIDEAMSVPCHTGDKECKDAAGPRLCEGKIDALKNDLLKVITAAAR